MDEFALIDNIVDVLGTQARGQWVQLGPGDDAALIEATPGMLQVASIDTLLGDVHFPHHSPADLIGYRALMVALSDLAAMAAKPRFVLVSLSLEAVDLAWVRNLALGMSEAAQVCGVYVCGGNLSRGPLNITVSVHGEVHPDCALTRSGAQPGEKIYVSGPLGGAAGCVRRREFNVGVELTEAQQRYYKPAARFDCIETLAQASAGVDVSDGLIADLGHIAKASGVKLNISSEQIPLGPDATLDDALFGGDDYELAVSSATALEGFVCIGQVYQGQGIELNGLDVSAKGYRHFTDE